MKFPFKTGCDVLDLMSEDFYSVTPKRFIWKVYYLFWGSVTCSFLFSKFFVPGPDPANIYLFKVNNRNTRKRCEICLKLTIKTRERRRSDVFIVNFEHISYLFIMFVLLTLNK